MMRLRHWDKTFTLYSSTSIAFALTMIRILESTVLFQESSYFIYFDTSKSRMAVVQPFQYDEIKQFDK